MLRAKTILFNPISLVHDRHVDIFRRFLSDWGIRCIYNPKFPWFHDKKENHGEEIFYFTKGYFQRIPKEIFDNVKLLILFTSQPRIPTCHLIQEATQRSIPIIAIEEVYQMILEQGLINNYLLPVDHFFVASEYEREKFIEAGIPEEVIETTGYIFRYNGQKLDSSQREALKKTFNLSANKLTATLSLSFLSPDGETLGIRKELLRHISCGLPERYELVIKPHPSEDDSNFRAFIAQYAPNARIVAPKTPINKVLDVTDVLINRGNSQVVIDALQRKIPVVVFPFGRRTFFHGFLDEVIIDEHRDIASVLALIEKKGIALYNRIFRQYLSITPEQALEKTIFRIQQITEKKELYRPQERLIELAIFWAWMGYPLQGKKILSQVKNIYSNKDILERIHRLMLSKTSREDLSALRGWAKEGYKQWILQSLWIKAAYLKGRRLDNQDKEWLGDFPPNMERLRFLNYAVILYWCYLRSDMQTESETLLADLSKEYGFHKDIKGLAFNDSAKHKKYYFNVKYCKTFIECLINFMLKNLLWRIENFRR